jgi:Opioid growth factor receptor (OGFr) conserved region
MPYKDQPRNSSLGVLISFYLSQSTDNRGRTIDEILTWDNNSLECTHDYIQWLFPLREASGFNPDAPVLDDQQIAAFRASDELRERLSRSFKLMLSFYGLQCDDAGEERHISKGKDFGQRSQTWLTPGNHNYLRITRILTSLRLLGLEEYAGAFLAFLEQQYKEEGERIGDTTFWYWQRAVTL